MNVQRTGLSSRRLGWITVFMGEVVNINDGQSMIVIMAVLESITVVDCCVLLLIFTVNCFVLLNILMIDCCVLLIVA